MAGKIKFKSDYQNSYDYFYDQVKDKTFFTQSQWEKAAKTGTLDSYVVELNELENHIDIEQFQNEYGTDYLNEDQVRMAMQNEVYKSQLSEMIKKDAVRYKTDENGEYILENGKPIEEKYETNLYDYNKSLLRNQAKYKIEENYNKALQDYKDSMKPFAKWLIGAGFNVSKGSLEVVKGFEGLITLFYSIGAGAYDAIKNEKKFGDAFFEKLVSDDVRFITKSVNEKVRDATEYDTVDEAIFDLERKISDNRDFDGNYSNFWEKLTTTLWQTAGQMVPSLVLGSLIPGKVAGKTISKGVKPFEKLTKIDYFKNLTFFEHKLGELISTGIFYTSNAVNQIKDTYDEFAKQGVSVNNTAILTNQLIKSSIEMGIESILRPFFGGSTGIDVFTKGGVRKSLSKNAAKTFFMDSFQEGLEEILQEFSNVIVDKIYETTVQENFGELSELTFENIALSFLAGSVMSMGSNAIEILMTSRISTDDIEIMKGSDIPTDIVNVKKGQVPVLNDEGELVDKVTGKKIKFKKLSKIASWNYNMNLQTYIESLSKLTELDEKYRNEGAFAPGTSVHNEYVNAVKTAYESVRILSSIFKTVGQKNFEQSLTLLDTMNKNMTQGSYVSGMGNMVKEDFANTLSGLSAESKRKLLDKIVAAHMDQIDKVIDKDTLEDVYYDEETDKKIAKFFEQYDKIVVTKNGMKAVSDEKNKILYIPKKQLTNTSYDSAILQVKEDAIVDYILNNKKHFKIKDIVIKRINELYSKKVGKEVTDTEAMFAFVYDDTFRDCAVRSEEYAYGLLELLLETKYLVDDKFSLKKLQILRDKLTSTLINYLIDYPAKQTTANLSLLDNAKRDYVKKNTYVPNMASRYIANGKLTDNEKEILKRRINNGLFEDAKKQELVKIVDDKKATKQQRNYLITELDNEYSYKYKGKFNNVIYLEEKGNFAKSLFNKFLMYNGIDLRNIDESNIQKVTEHFEVFTGKVYSFAITDNPEEPVEIYTIKQEHDTDLRYYGTTTGVGTDMYIPSKKLSKINSFVNKKYKKDNITVNDLIYNKEFLSDKLKDDIIKYFNLQSEDDISQEHTLLYLNKILQNEYMVIGVDVNNNFVLLDLEPYTNVFENVDFTLDELVKLLGGFYENSKTTRAVNISKLNILKPDFVKTLPKNTKLIIVQDDTGVRGMYDYDTNTIVLYHNKKTAKENSFLSFAHELQHLISYNNNLSKGGSVFLNYLSVKDALDLLYLLEREKVIDKIPYKREELEKALTNNSFESLAKYDYGTKQRYLYEVFYNLYRSTQDEVMANHLVNKMLPFTRYVDEYDNSYFSTPFGKSYKLLEESRFANKQSTKEGKVETGNTTQLVAYDIPSQEKPLTERQKKIQENKLKKPIYYKPGKYKVAKVDKDGKIIYDEKGRIKYEYKQDVYETRYAGKKESAGTNLEKYGYVTKELQNDFKSFIVKATPDIDKDIWDKLVEGKLNRNYVLRKIKEGNLDNKTFELINDSFFKNTEIKNQEELDTYVELTSEYAALYYTLKRTSLLEKYGDKITKDNIKQIIDIISRDSVLSKMYIEYEENFNKSWGKELNIDRGLLRLNWLSKFDGTIYTAGHIANIARRTAIQTYFVTNKEVSLQSTISGTDLSIEDTLRDDYSQDAYEQILNDMSNSQEFEALKRLIILQSQKKAEKEDADKTEIYKETKSKLARLQTIYDETPEKIHSMFIAQTSKMTVEQKHKLLIGTVIEEQLDRKLKENEEKKLEELSKKFATKYERTTRNIINNIAHTAVTISNRLTANEKRRFLDKNKDLFHSLNNKIVIKQGWYKGKTKQELEQIEERVREISREVKAGAWHSVKEYKQFKKMQAEIEKLRNELINEKLKTKREVITINNNDDIIVNTSVEMPSKLKQILDDVFYKTAKTKVQEISLETSEHITKNYNSFVEDNASVLNSLTNEEVEEIVNFYLSSEIVPETNKARQYLLTRLFLSTFIIKQNEAGVFNISQENIDNLTLSVEKLVSIGAQLPSLWRQSLAAIRETREMLIRGLGNEMLNIVFEKDTIRNLREAVDSGNFEKMKLARKQMYDEGLEKLKKEKLLGKYKALKSLLIEKADKQKSVDGADVNKIDKKLKEDLKELKDTYDKDYEKIKSLYKQTYKESTAAEKKFLSKQTMTLDQYLERFIQFERTMMLSGPGTWVRNQVSNVVIGGLRAPSEKIGSATSKVLQKIFPKKFKKVTGQYKLIGTKVTPEVKSFIKTELVDSNLLELISVGLSKQASADIDYNYKVDNIVDLIKQGIKNDLRSKSQHDNKLINDIYNFIYKRMSDDKSVNKTMLQYFGKMLTEKNVNLKNGMTNEVIKILVDAYTFAASEYMHKTNLITEFENWLKGKNYKAYFMYKQLLPFAAASWNWFVEGLNYTPIGLVKSIMQFAKLENTIAKIEDDGKISSEFAQYATIKNIGKGVIGSIGTLVGALLALLGVARLDKEDDKYKLFVGNTAVDITDVFGTQSILISMSIVSAIKDGETLKSVVATAIDTMFQDSTFQDTINLFRYSDTFSDFVLYLPEKFLRAMIPNFFKQIASIINVKEVKFDTGIVGRLERLVVQSIPGIAYLFPHYIDPYTGEEQIPYNMPLLTNLINKLTPVKIYPYRVSEYEKEATSLGVSKGMLSGEYTINDKDVKLNSSQRKLLNEYYAKLNRADLDDLFKNKTKYKVRNDEGTYDELYYKEMTDKQKATVIDRLMSNNSGYAKVYVLTQEMGYKYYTTNAERETLRNLGITKNIFVKNNKYNGYVK